MTSSAAPRHDNWAVHRGDVRDRIVEAFMDLLDGEHPMALSMPAVAERAGISVRTLYRYFPSKDDLLRAAPYVLERRSRDVLHGRAMDRTNAHDYLRTLWSDFDAHRPSVVVQHSTRAGRALRIERLPPARDRVDAIVPAEIQGSRRSEVVDLVVALGSSAMFLELVDRMGHPPGRAAEMIAEVIETILATETARATGGADDAQEGTR